MERFSISIMDEYFEVEQSLHENIYQVSSAEKKFLVGRRGEGDWELILPDSDQVNFPVNLIGEEIERQMKK